MVVAQNKISSAIVVITTDDLAGGKVASDNAENKCQPSW
jgi:hypothetical protein